MTIIKQELEKFKGKPVKLIGAVLIVTYSHSDWNNFILC